jgi:hypothetical protein
MKKAILILLSLFCTAALAQDLPKIAVYVTGDVPDNERRALGTRMLSALINSGRYIGIERSNTFLAEIEKEQQKQRSGSIDDDQISELGRQFGVKYVCIADIIPAFGSYQVSARIVDVETAVVIFIGEEFSPLKSANDLREVSNKVVKNMFSEPAKTEPEPKPEPIALPVAEPPPPPPPPPPVAPPAKKPLKRTFWIGLGVDAVGAAIIAYGLMEEDMVARRVKSGELGNSYPATKMHEKNRNMAYIAGAAVILTGISIQIFF